MAVRVAEASSALPGPDGARISWETSVSPPGPDWLPMVPEFPEPAPPSGLLVPESPAFPLLPLPPGPDWLPTPVFWPSAGFIAFWETGSSLGFAWIKPISDEEISGEITVPPFWTPSSFRSCSMAAMASWASFWSFSVSSFFFFSSSTLTAWSNSTRWVI